MKTLKIEFLTCGSPNDAFFSQVAMYRRALDALGGIYRDARLVMCFDHGEGTSLPDRWIPFLDRIEFCYAPLDHFGFMDGRQMMYANHRLHSYTLVDLDADVSIVCDADTLLLQPFEEEFLEDITRVPAIGGVLAHHAPDVTDELGHDYSRLTNEQFWHAISSHVLGAPIQLKNRYVLTDDTFCPFYINYGFVAAPPSLMTKFHSALCAVQPKVREFLDNIYHGQLAVPLAVERAGLPTRVLPMRYNFPNTNEADEKYPDELARVRVLHFQRTNMFDRHKIFATAEGFNDFMAMDLDGSNAVLQRHVRELTCGVYPFSSAIAA